MWRYVNMHIDQSFAESFLVSVWMSHQGEREKYKSKQQPLQWLYMLFFLVLNI